MRVIILLLALLCALNAQAQTKAEIYREPSPKIIKKGYSLVLDRGVLHKAIISSKGTYIFSEKGAGVKPLVIIGTLYDIADFLYKRRDVIIDNTIPDLPNIYLSATYYKPKERFNGITSVGDVVVILSKSLLDFVPGDTVSDMISNTGTFTLALKDLIASGKKPKNKATSALIYVKISYLKDKHSIFLGRKKVYMGTVLNRLFNIKETSV